MRIAIFDYQITPNNPIGGCHRRMLQGLCCEHEFTVFAADFDNPCPERIVWVRVPTMRRPLFLLFITFYLLAPLYFWFHCRRKGVRFDLVQTVEGYLPFGKVAYSHFCHRAYLKHHWKRSGASGPRGIARWLDHALRSVVEPWIYRRVQRVVVPSRGLARELSREYPYILDKLTIIANPVDVEKLKQPRDFNASAFRQSFGLAPDDVVQVFVALGHFERKGLPLILEAMRKVNLPNLKLIVVGGTSDLLGEYQRRVRKLGLQDSAIFVGMQQDIRPYLWASGAFMFPSSYEVFPLVSLEAAAAGLPLIATSVYGVEEFLCDGVNGILIDHTAEGVAQGIKSFLALSIEERKAMGVRAAQDVQNYDVPNFVKAWRKFYEKPQA